MGSKADVRAAFRRAVFGRDRYRCVVCGRQWSEADADPSLGRINAHHITDRREFPNGGYVPENGVTVCDGEGSCHWRCEAFHRTEGEAPEEGLSPSDLYAKIGSTYVAALNADARLSKQHGPGKTGKPNKVAEKR